MEISPQRQHTMRTAIELDVDESDFAFQSLVERSVWQELLAEHLAFAERDDLVWVAA